MGRARGSVRRETDASGWLDAPRTEATKRAIDAAEMENMAEAARVDDGGESKPLGAVRVEAKHVAAEAAELLLDF